MLLSGGDGNRLRCCGLFPVLGVAFRVNVHHWDAAYRCCPYLQESGGEWVYSKNMLGFSLLGVACQ